VGVLSIYDGCVSPTVFRERGYRFYFFSREERRMHVHVHHADGEAKVWLEPEVALAQNHGLSRRRLSTVLELVRRHEDEIRAAWRAHFGC
jgi:hypothetical protein